MGRVGALQPSCSMTRLRLGCFGSFLKPAKHDQPSGIAVSPKSPVSRGRYPPSRLVRPLLHCRNYVSMFGRVAGQYVLAQPVLAQQRALACYAQSIPDYPCHCTPQCIGIKLTGRQPLQCHIDPDCRVNSLMRRFIAQMCSRAAGPSQLMRTHALKLRFLRFSADGKTNPAMQCSDLDARSSLSVQHAPARWTFLLSSCPARL